MDRLSDRELRILKLVAEGNTDEQIGDTLNYSRSTVKNAMSSVYVKLGLWDEPGNRRVMAAVLYTRDRWGS